MSLVFRFSALSGRTLGREREQASLGNVQISQAEQRQQLRRVGQATVAHLLVSEEILDDVKRVSTLTRTLALICSIRSTTARGPYPAAHGPCQDARRHAT